MSRLSLLLIPLSIPSALIGNLISYSSLSEDPSFELTSNELPRIHLIS